MEDWLELIDHHLHLRRHMEAQDIYKLLYQGILGPEHLISSPAEFKAVLWAEYDTLGAAQDEALWEPVRPDGELLRLNLRPFKARGLSLDKLIDACLATARHAWDAPAELRKAWNVVVESCAGRRWPLQAPADFSNLTARLEELNYPPVHHSRQYVEAYWPSYRLLAAEFLGESTAVARKARS